jgi:TPR repeat protein
VLASTNEGRARRIAAQLEQIRAAMQRQWPWARTMPDKPILVLVAKGEGDLRKLLPQFWERRDSVRPAGLLVEGLDRYYLVLDGEARGPDLDTVNPYLTAYHEYIHLLFRLNFGPVPLWFEEGLAEYYGNTVIRDEDLLRGAIIPWHVLRLRGERLLPLPELLAIDRHSPHYNEQSKAGVFYAQSWAFVHFLLQGADRVHAERLNRLANALHRGTAPADALAAAFDDLPGFQAQLERYVRQRAYRYERVGLDVDAGAELTVRPVSDDDEAAARAGLHLALGRVADAAAVLAARAGGEAPSLRVVQGLLAEREGKQEEAARAYRQALEAGTTILHAPLWLADHELRNGDTRSATAALEYARRAEALAPRNSQVISRLVPLLERDGQFEAALETALAAVSNAPTDAVLRLLAARLEWTRANPDEALRLARLAHQLARDEATRKAAATFVAQVERQRLPELGAASPAALQAQCDRGRPEACAVLGMRLRAGADAAPDPARARALLTRGCSGGAAEGCAELGELLSAEGPGQDVPGAVAAFVRGCELGHGLSCAMAGARFEGGGGGIARDAARAAALYESGCKAQEPWACGALGALLLHGRGVARDPARAAELFESACAAGLAPACVQRAVLLARGSTRAADRERGRSILKDHCDTDVAQACVQLALLHAAAGTPADLEQAGLLLDRACRQGDAQACGLASSLPRQPR